MTERSGLLGGYDTVHYLDSFLSQNRGVLGRYPECNEAYVFEFGKMKKAQINMVGVRKPLCVRWYNGQALVSKETLRPWIGFGSNTADSVIETRPEGNHD